MLDDYKDILDISDLREIFNCGRNMAYSMVNDGTIYSVRCGRLIRIPKQSVIEFINRNKNQF